MGLKQRLKQRFKKIKLFIGKYSIDELINSIQLLIKDLTESSGSGGTIIAQLFNIIRLAALYAALRGLIFIKYLLKNIYNILKKIRNLFISLFTISIQEANCYWKKLSQAGKSLSSDLEEIITNLLDNISDLYQKLTDNPNPVTNKNSNQNSSKNYLVILLKLIAWLLLFAVSMIASLCLVLTFFTGVPLLHKIIRKKIVGVNSKP